MFLVSSRSCLRSIHWSQVLSWEWRCSWSSADRQCSNYIWVINNIIAYKGATYIRGFTVVTVMPFHFQCLLTQSQRLLMTNSQPHLEPHPAPSHCVAMATKHHIIPACKKGASAKLNFFRRHFYVEHMVNCVYSSWYWMYQSQTLDYVYISYSL